MMQGFDYYEWVSALDCLPDGDEATGFLFRRERPEGTLAIWICPATEELRLSAKPTALTEPIFELNLLNCEVVYPHYVGRELKILEFRSGGSGPTDWELLQIQQNPVYWNSIQFWKGGEMVSNPFK